MDNIILLKKTKELEDLCRSLGFEKTLFLDDVKVIEAKTNKDLLKKYSQFTIVKPITEDLLRFALEKTKINLVYGMEFLHPKDSVHYVRGGLDQIICKIAAEKGKIIGFSFSDILHAKNQPKLLGRMRANLRLCKKYNVHILFGNFSTCKEDIRSKKDLVAFLRTLRKIKK
ncbi:hypothetical protein HQ489_01720 [Candidatus Woesearchaeota archaeon]|nr:hypothetical protein [Candidatus Woesearchaeota archaeon]